jgi:hypothetical protein
MIVVGGQLHRARRCPPVPEGVRDRFTCDPVSSDLHGRRKRRQRPGGGDPHRIVCGWASGRGDRVHREVLAQRVGQAQFVERGRPQVVDHPAHCGHGLAHPVPQALDPVREVGIGGQPAGQAVELEREAGQFRPHAIVQVAAQPAPLLLPGGDQGFPAPLQLSDERCGLDERAGRAGGQAHARVVHGYVDAAEPSGLTYW